MIVKIDNVTVKLQQPHMTSPKICHQNNVTKIFHFQAPPLAKS